MEADAFIRDRERRGRAVPDSMRQVARAHRHEPVRPEFVEYWQAFHDLSRSRVPSMGLSPIRPRDVNDWCRLHGVAPRRRRVVWRIMRALDDTAIEHCAKRRPA